ncbi:hypothetical protein KRR40_39970 [Niabella defluvii]|nr:hypothetical protein KRR40_39970 [Niabella sp. I65]
MKPLNGVPLIKYSLDYARSFAVDADICVSTDDPDIIQYLKEIDYQVPFVRPAYLATDTAGSYGVIVHAVSYYKSIGVEYNAVVLLQPTSPFRKKNYSQTDWLYFQRKLTWCYLFLLQS